MANSFRDALKEIEKLGSQRPAVYDWLDEEFKKKEAQRALEKEARRKAEEWIRQRPTLQKAVDVVLPGSQFRTPPATFSPAPRTEPVSEEPWSEKIARALIGSKEFREQTFKDLLSFLPLAPAAIPGAGPALAPVVSPAISKAVAPAARAAEKAVTAYRALPKAAQTAAKVAAGIGAAATAEEMTRGAIVPKAKEQTLPAKFGASLRAGFGDLVAATGTVAKMLKQEGLGEKLKRAGEAVRTGFEAEPVEFNWKSFFDPDWYAVNVARAVPLTAALIPAMYLGYKSGGRLGAKIGLGPFGRAILGSLMGAAASRPLESAFEAASTYEDYLARNPGDTEGAERAARETFIKNLPLGVLDLSELATAFAPVQIRPLSRIGNTLFRAAGPNLSRVLRVAGRAIGAASQEAIEEGIQEVIQRHSLGEPATFDSKMKEAMAIGGLFGAGMGGVGAVVEHIRNRTLDKLSPALKTEVTEKAAKNARTMPPEKAWEQALDEVMESDPEKGAIIAGAVDEAVAELDGLIEEAGTLYQRPEIEAIARKAVEKTEKAPSVPPTPKKTVTKAIGKPAEEFSPGDIVFDKKGRRWRVVDTSDPSLLEVVNEKGARTKLGRKAVVKAAEESETVISEEKPVGEIEKAPSVPPLSVETYVEGEMAPVPETPILEEIEMAPQGTPAVPETTATPVVERAFAEGKPAPEVTPVSEVVAPATEEVPESSAAREVVEAWNKADKETRVKMARRLGWNKRTSVGEEEIMADTPSEDETYPLPALEELRNKADIALANRVKGVPREKDIYALPLFAPQKTSVKQVARGLRLAAEKGIFKKGMVVADIGGGLYNQGTQYLAEHGITNLVYDPYARPEEHNNSVLQQIKARGGADAVALNNVLNVIPKAAERADVLRFSYGLLKNGGQMVVTVYEGNKSGKGSMKEFKDGTYTWQENRTLDSYEKEIREVLPGANVEKKHGAFIITKPADEHDYNIYALAGRKKTKKVITVNPRPQEPSKLSPKAAREISERIAEAVNTVARSTRMMGRKFAGMGAAYERWPHAIRTRRAYFDQWRTIGHELGHAFFFAAGFNPDPNEMAAVVKAVYPGGQAPAKTEIPEGFAEFFMLWFADNAEARRLAPNTARELEKYLNANPEIQEVFDQCMAIAEEDLLGTPLERMRHLTVRRGTRLAPAIGEYEVPWWKRLTFRFADGSIPLRDLYEEAASKGFDGLDPAKLYAIWGMAREEANQLFAGKPRFKYGGFVLPGKRSLQEIVEEAAKRPNGVILFNDIYKALRYQERAEKGFVTPYPKEEFDKTVEQAEKDYPDLVKLVKEYAENLSEINLRLLVAEEVISEEAADRIRKGSKYYLPLYYPAKSQVRGTAQDPLRSSGPGVLRYRGHTAQTLDFIEATLLRLHDTVQAVELNRMMKTIEESLKQPEMGRFGVFIERPIVVKGIRLDNLTRQIEDNFLGELDPDDESRVIKLFMPGLESDLKKSEPVIVARHGDKSIFMRIAPDLFEAVQSMRPIQYDWFTKVLTILAQVSRVGALANIRYLTNAFTRDVIQSGIQSKTTFERSMVKGFMQGALTAAGFGENAATLFDLYIQSGAYGSAVQEVLNSMRRSVTTDGLAATPAPGWKRTAKNVFVRTVNAPLDVLRILEEAPRIAEFEAVLKKELAKHNLTVDDMLKGKVPESLIREAEKALIEAAYASREVVVNFGLQGTSTGWRRYVRTVPFLQGSVQGIYRAYRQIKDAPGKTMLHWLVYVLPLTLIAWALSRDDDKYRDMPSDARDAYWWFPVGRATFIALAKPYEYALPANILERFLDWLADSDDPNRRKPLEDLVTAVKKSFSVQPTSMVVNTIWDLARNKTYFDSPIVPQREMQVSPEYRYGPETKKASIRLAQIAALFMGEKAPSPRQVDYFMRGVFGGAGETFLDLLSLPLKGPGSEKRAGIEYAPVIGPLLYGPREGGSRIVDKFYQDYDRAQKLYNDYRLHGRKLTEQEARLVYAIPAMRALADDLASLRSELREIEQSDEYTPEEKRRAALRYNWISRVAAGYLYGQPVPAAPPQLEITEADVQDTLRRCEQKIELAMERAAERPGGPI